MGACAGNNISRRKDPSGKYTLQEDQIAKYNLPNLPKLNFKGCLSNIKLKNYQYDQIAIRVEIQEENCFLLPQMKVNFEGTAKWKSFHDFTINASEYQLRKRSISLAIVKQKTQVIGQLEINLYMIATGPYHQDFAIKLKDGKIVRLSFDLRISQILEVKVLPLLVSINLDKEYLGDVFTFSIRTLIGNHTETSQPSYMIRIGMDQQLKQSNGNGKLKVKRHASISNFQKVIRNGQTVIWSKSQHQDIPSFDIRFPFDQFSSASFSFIFWSVSSVVNDQKQKQIASCVFSFNKLTTQKTQQKQIGNLKFDICQLTLEQDLRNQGSKVGKASIKFLVNIEQHIKQMQVCVRTEEGILKSSPIFSQNAKNQELRELVKLRQSIESKFIALNASNGRYLQQKKIINQIIQMLKRVYAVLLITSKQSLILYKYNDRNQLEQAQKILIDLGDRIVINYLKSSNQDIVSCCWNILRALLKRSQLNLTNIGYQKKQIEQIQRKQISSQLDKKLKIGLQYQKFLYKLLSLALKSLSVKGFQQEKSFAQMFCAYAYFRIPKFRNQVLQIILHQDDPQLTQWRGTQFNLMGDPTQNQIVQNQNAFAMLFDWGNYFHKCIQNLQKSQSNKLQLIKIMSDDKWKQRISKRSGAYCSFIKYWVQYIQQIAVKTKDIKWNYFPGYTKIIRSFLLEMKKRQIQKYTLSFRQAAVKLLTNSKLLNIFLTIVFSKAHVFDAAQLSRILQLISSYFKTLKQNFKLVPSNFNYPFFFNAIKIIIQKSDFSLGIAKTLQIFYQYFDLFSIDFQNSFGLYLLGPVFFKLFLHWSNNVRLVFYHLITMRIYHEANIVYNDKETQKNQLKYIYSKTIKPRYQQLMILLQNAQKLRIQQDKKKFINKYQKDLYKKMKKKMIEKKKNKNSMDQSTVSISNPRLVETPSYSQKKLSSDNVIYDIQMLNRPRLERYQSVVMKNSLEKLYQNNPNLSSQKDNKNYSDSKLPDTLVSFVDTNARGNRKLTKTVSTQQYPIIPPTESEINYIRTGMQEYAKIYQIFLKLLKLSEYKVPNVSLEIPDDEKDLRPDRKIDEW